MSGYLYAAPPPDAKSDHWERAKDVNDTYKPPPGPDDAKQKMNDLEKLCDILGEMDEFDVMRAISNLDDAAQKRIFDWLKSCLESK